jgi:4-hydroxy-3-methylbut-2-enyl diphosphate reductase
MGAHLLFSAHGVAPNRWEEAKALGLNVIDATCPLVEKVHREAVRFAAEGDTVILIGDRGHDEVVGTAGWAGDKVRVILREDEVATLEIEDPAKVAYVTQTTLTVRDCERVVNALRERFPALRGPSAGDICYATQNRQLAVTELSDQADLVLVVGDKASANSRRLADICLQKGKPSHLLASAAELDPGWFSDVQTVVITSGASAPESLVCELVEKLRELFACEMREVTVAEEDLRFALPRGL